MAYWRASSDHFVDRFVHKSLMTTGEFMDSMTHVEPRNESCNSGVAWGAIIAGAFAAAAVSLILLILGSALGLSSVSPWSNPETIAVFTVKTAIWLIVMQWVAAGLGGYLTGRLRTRWVGVHTDEVFFRDTAHGFLAWALATVLTASVLASATASIVSGGVQAASAISAGAAARPGAEMAPPAPGKPDEANGYYIDSLFRNANFNQKADLKDARAETTKILMTGLKNGTVPEEDKIYLAEMVSAHAGISKEEAAKRVDNAITQLNTVKEKIKQKAEEARKTAMHISIYMFLSMLVGAFVASSAAAIGGRQRDEY